MDWKPFVWGFCLLFTLSYLFATLVAESVSDWLLRNDGDENPLRKAVERHYGSFPDTLDSVLMASVHATFWSKLSEPLMTVNWYLGPFFFVYIMVMDLCVLIIITAL